MFHQEHEQVNLTFKGYFASLHVANKWEGISWATWSLPPALHYKNFEMYGSWKKFTVTTHIHVT